MRIGYLLSGAAGLLCCAAGIATGQGASDSCAALAMAGRFADTQVRDAHRVAAAGNLPAYCEVTGTISPAPGSQIGVVYRLPENWNGKILGLGGGGWAGNLRIETAAPDLAKGYATAQTDGGHPGTNPGDNGWVLGPDGKSDVVALTDFSWRAGHALTGLGKALVAAY